MRRTMATLALAALPSVAYADEALTALGTVCWNMDGLPAKAFQEQRARLGERCLRFEDASHVMSSVFLAGTREGFGDRGTYSVAGDRLTIAHEADSEAWGARTGSMPLSMTCRVTITAGPSLTLDDCPLSGTWSR